MKNFTKVSLTIFLGLLLSVIIQNNSFATLYSVTQTMSGSQEVPPVAGGTGTFTATYNSVTRLINYTITFNITGTLSAGHFHGPAELGSNAGVLVGFTGLPLGTSSGTFSGSATFSVSQDTTFLNGHMYANLHSSVYGGGAVRAQLFPQAISTLNLTYLIQGLYNSGTNTMVGDTVTVNIRNSVSPYAIVGSAKTFLNSGGNSNVNFTGVSNSTNYYIQIIHRNSLQIYSGTPFSFTSNAGGYDFTTSSSQALGNNMILSGSKYTGYSGDINHDDFIDLSDVVGCSNDVNAFVTGYVVTDLNGDGIVALDDLLICYNNSSVFATAVVPTP